MKKIGIIITLLVTFSTSAYAKSTLDASKSGWEATLFQNISDGKNVSDIWIYDLHSDAIPALHFSLLRGKMETAKKLVELGADISEKTSSGYSIFNYVCSRAKSHSSKVPVFIIDKALNAGLSINDFEGELPRSAACVNNPYVVSYYQENNVQFNINLFSFDQPIFFYFAKGLKVEDFNKLLYLKPDLSLRSKSGNNVLHHMMNHNYISNNKNLSEEIANLVELGANVNARNNLTSTPLMEAVFEGKYEYVRVLVESGAIVGLRNKHRLEKNRSALDYAKGQMDRAGNGDKKDRYTRIWRYLLEQEDLQTL